MPMPKNDDEVIIVRNATVVPPEKADDNNFSATIVTDNAAMVYDPYEGVIMEIIDIAGMKVPTTIQYRSKHPAVDGIIATEDIKGRVTGIMTDPDYKERHHEIDGVAVALKGTIEMSRAQDAQSLAQKMREKIVEAVSAEYIALRSESTVVKPGGKTFYRGKELVNKYSYPIVIRNKSILNGLAAVGQGADSDSRIRQKLQLKGVNMELTEQEKIDAKKKADEEAATLVRQKLDAEMVEQARAAATKETIDAMALIEGKRELLDPTKYEEIKKKIGTKKYDLNMLRTDIVENIRTKPVNIQTRDQSSERGQAISAMVRQNLNLPISEEEKKMIRGQGHLPKTMHDIVKWDSIQNNRALSPYADGDEIYRYYLAEHYRTAYNFGPDSLVGLTMNVANVALKQGYDSIPTNYEDITEPESVKDFKQQTILDTTSLSDLPEYIDGTKPKQLTMQDFHEVYSIDTYAATTGISRRALINDTALGELTQLSRLIGETVSRKKEDIVFTHLTKNGLAGPVTHESGGALNIFHATNKNLKTTSGLVSTATFTVAMLELYKILKAAPDKTSAAQVMGLPPTILLTGMNQMVAIEQFFTSVSDMVATNSNVVNIIGRRFPLSRSYSIILQIKLDAASAANTWYIFSRKPMKLLNLNGAIMPTIRSENSAVGEAFGVKYDVVYDMGTYFPSWRYCHMNDGKSA